MNNVGKKSKMPSAVSWELFGKVDIRQQCVAFLTCCIPKDRIFNAPVMDNVRKILLSYCIQMPIS